MHPQMNAYKCAIVRGGSSKGIFLMKNDLPKDPKQRDNLILSIFGSPDLRQIDGLGGSDTLTSKLAIIGPSTRKDADVDYTFGQVSTVTPMVDYGGNCGNISSAVGPFAIDHGLVEAVEPVTTVRIHLTNTDRIIIAEVPVKDGKACVEGDYHIDGVPGTGAKITLDWSDVVGGSTGKLLPTGNVKDSLTIDGKQYTISVVDAGNIVVFVSAADMGITGTETPDEIDNNGPLMELIEHIRGEVCVKLGLVKTWQDAAKITPYQPFFAMVSPATDYACFNSASVNKEQIDVTSRLLFMLKMHKTYAITGTVATGAAARVEGSVVWDMLSPAARKESMLRIGHPAGVLEMEAQSKKENGIDVITRLCAYRTARTIMEGLVYVKNSVLK